MPRPLVMPPIHELPNGSRRRFVQRLFWYLREANRPTLEQISERIRARDDLPGTASKETVRSMLKGKTVPVRWATAQSVFLVLCELAGVKPEDQVEGSGYDLPTYEEEFRSLWNAALEAPVGRLEGPPATWDQEPPF